MKSAFQNSCLSVVKCPGFGQDRVNLHWNPGRDTAGWADPTWPNRAGYSIPCAGHAGFWLGAAGQRELTRGSGARSGGGSGERLCCAVCFVLCILLICIVVVAVPFVCCSLKLPLSRPTSFCLFLSILLAPWRGEGQLRGAFVDGCSQTTTLNLAPKRGAGITAGLSSGC